MKNRKKWLFLILTAFIITKASIFGYKNIYLRQKNIKYENQCKISMIKNYELNKYRNNERLEKLKEETKVIVNKSNYTNFLEKLYEVEDSNIKLVKFEQRYIKKELIDGVTTVSRNIDLEFKLLESEGLEKINKMINKQASVFINSHKYSKTGGENLLSLNITTKEITKLEGLD